MTRKYRQKRRAQLQEETRQRIVQATVELHQELGPSRTTVSAIAERAGVQRLTVYRHFPDERALIDACSSQFDRDNPPPDVRRWLEIEDAEARLRVGLSEFYTYYERTEEMTLKVLRDAPTNPILAEKVEGVRQALDFAKQILAEPWIHDEEDARLIDAAVGHALDFYTWLSLVRQQGLSNESAVELMVRTIRATSSDDPSR